jgi:hypothetical protein
MTKAIEFAVPNHEIHPSSEASSSDPALPRLKDGIAISSESLIEGSEPHKLSSWIRFVGLFWDLYVAEPRERKYLQKLDAFLWLV